MSNRSLRAAIGLSAVWAVVLMTSDAWAVHYPLGPSKNDWGMKYEVQVTPVGSDKLNVAFTLLDEGRLKPIHSITVVALRSVGGNSFAYDVKAPIPLQTTADGKRTGHVQIPRQFADGALFRILTLSVDGRRQTAGAALYDIPLHKFLSNAATTASSPRPANTPPSLRRQ